MPLDCDQQELETRSWTSQKNQNPGHCYTAEVPWMPEVHKEQWWAAGRQKEVLSTYWSQAVRARSEEPEKNTNRRQIFHLNPSFRTHSSSEAHRGSPPPGAKCKIGKDPMHSSITWTAMSWTSGASTELEVKWPSVQPPLYLRAL